MVTNAQLNRDLRALEQQVTTLEERVWDTPGLIASLRQDQDRKLKDTDKKIKELRTSHSRRLDDLENGSTPQGSSSDQQDQLSHQDLQDIRRRLHDLEQRPSEPPLNEATALFLTRRLENGREKDRQLREAVEVLFDAAAAAPSEELDVSQSPVNPAPRETTNEDSLNEEDGDDRGLNMPDNVSAPDLAKGEDANSEDSNMLMHPNPDDDDDDASTAAKNLTQSPRPKGLATRHGASNTAVSPRRPSQRTKRSRTTSRQPAPVQPPKPSHLTKALKTTKTTKVTKADPNTDQKNSREGSSIRIGHNTPEDSSPEPEAQAGKKRKRGMTKKRMQRETREGRC
ncbi:hypothetical protein H2203_005863 [Taxawa tesnikishii (nom. ined.)]|nr:hypothetical protein H2203_005863 [Dothideales sp. JES 119]